MAEVLTRSGSTGDQFHAYPGAMNITYANLRGVQQRTTSAPHLEVKRVSPWIRTWQREYALFFGLLPEPIACARQMLNCRATEIYSGIPQNLPASLSGQQGVTGSVAGTKLKPKRPYSFESSRHALCQIG